MSRRRDVGFIILWSGVSNAVLAGLFIATANWAHIEGYVSKFLMSRETVVARAPDPLAEARMHRRNMEQGVGSVQSAAKGALGLTRMKVSGTYGETREDESIVEAETAALSQDEVPSTEEVQGMRVAPILRKDGRTGRLEIGNFKSMTFAGDTEECLDMGYSMLSDAGMSDDALNLMTQSDMITVAKICTSNGLVVLTCRNQQITISPRHSRPDDRCLTQD